MMLPEATTLYNAGLGNLKICIESRLENAGATLRSGSVTHRGWPAPGSPPDCLEIRVAAVDCTILAAVFSRDEIAACHKGVTSVSVSDKINLIVDEFVDNRARSGAGLWDLGDVHPGLAG